MTEHSRSARAGLWLLGLCSVGDIVSLAFTDGDHPPYAIAAVGALIGIWSLVLVVRAWRDASRGVRTLVVLRVISAVSAAPAMFVDDVPRAAIVAAGAVIVLNVLGILLLAGTSRVAAVAR